jgi:S1-C subfamily serine protease
LLYRSLKKLSLLVALSGLACALAHAQAKTSRPSTPPPDTLQIESSSRQSPQVITVVHRLNGIKALALLQRNGEAITMVDEDVVTASNAVTSIIAGFVLGDGQSIVARLPQAEAEIEASTFFSPTPVPRPQIPNQPLAPVAQRATAASTSPRALMPLESTGFVVVESSGKQYAARYVGLDGLSGLSLLKIPGLNVPVSRDVNEEQLAAGQTVRLFAPMRAIKGSNATQSTVSLRVGEIEGKIAGITRTSTGGRIEYLTINAQNLTPEIVGGIALNEAGEAVGIVETINANLARLIPSGAVRRAAKRVLVRQTSVPRPWLGVRGEAVAAMPLEKFLPGGWSQPEAAALKGKQEGIFLTAVAPGTPAALADLRPGDVIVRVNDFEVKNAEDFSFVLNEVGSGATVNFTLFRGQLPKPPAPMPPLAPMVMPTFPPVDTVISPEAFKFKPLVVSVKLSESLNPARAMKLAEEYSTNLQMLNPFPLVARGIETATLSARAATHLGSRGGMLVLFVDPASPAAQAGLKAFDVIETVEGKPVGQTAFFYTLPQGNPQKLTLGIMRDSQRMAITIQQKDKK